MGSYPANDTDINHYLWEKPCSIEHWLDYLVSLSKFPWLNRDFHLYRVTQIMKRSVNVHLWLLGEQNFQFLIVKYVPLRFMLAACVYTSQSEYWPVLLKQASFTLVFFFRWAILCCWNLLLTVVTSFKARQSYHYQWGCSKGFLSAGESHACSKEGKLKLLGRSLLDKSLADCWDVLLVLRLKHFSETNRK